MAQRPEERQRLRVAQAWGVSPKRFNGWEPKRVVEYEYERDAYGRAGKLLRITETVEPEWDDATRALAEGLDLHDAEVCPGCHLHPSNTDPERNAYTFEERLCPVCRGQDIHQRIISDRDDKAREKLGEHPDPEEPLPSDGRHIYLRRMTPEEVEARKNQQGRADGRPPRKRPS